MRKIVAGLLSILCITQCACTAPTVEGKVMPIVTIDQPNHDVLKTVAQPVTFPLSQESEQTIADLKATFMSLASPYGKPAGLAAPQIGVSQRIFIVQVPPEAKQKRQQVFDTIPPTIFINPSYIPVLSAGKYRDWEGCYSVPNKMGEVDRYFEIDFSAYTEDGKPVHFTAKGFYARLLQHETDHLNGKDYLDHPCKGCRFGDQDAMLKISKAENAKK
ncbi:MAG: peptide deformylase [Gammaproteobacteria bacterium]|nr:peptide deformylase [Gammaproteobacteria bacterium]